MKRRKRLGNVAYHTFMIAFCIIMLYPLLWMIASSFKPTHEIMTTVDSLIPETFTLENYVQGWKGFARYTFGTFFKNSLFIAVMRTIAAVVSSSIVAFGFARIKFRGRKLWFALMISTMCLPGMVLQVPTYLMYNSWGWVGSLKPLLVSCWFGNAFDIFLIMQFMKNIPMEIDEAAVIDGCSKWRLFTRIQLPLIKPALASVGILSFIGSWGDYYGALLYLNKTRNFPVAFALTLYESELGVNYGPMLAMSVLSLVPIIILFFFFQKQLIEGISTTGLKG